MTVVVAIREATTKYLPGKVIVRALRGVTLYVLQGEIISIAGPSGSVKTTLLNIIVFVDTPTSGTVQIVGRDIDKPSFDTFWIIAEIAIRGRFANKYYTLIIESIIGFGLPKPDADYRKFFFGRYGKYQFLESGYSAPTTDFRTTKKTIIKQAT